MALVPGRETESPSTLAQQTLDEEKRKKQKKQAKQKAQEKKTDVTGAGSAASGAASAALGGPIGAIAGAGIGAAAGAIDANNPPEDPNRPKHRRRDKALSIYQEKKRSKERALATLSQAVFDWAASIR